MNFYDLVDEVIYELEIKHDTEINISYPLLDEPAKTLFDMGRHEDARERLEYEIKKYIK